MSNGAGWLSRIGAALLLLVALAGALCLAILVPYYLAPWVTRVPLLFIVSVLCFLSTLWLGARGSARLWGASSGARFAARAAGLSTVVFAAALYWLVLKPTPDPGSPPPFEHTRYWQLATGSRIAYSEFDPPPGMAVKPDPIVFLHGGPGARHAPFDESIYGSLSQEGFRVFLFDQVGTGLSDFLPHVRDYTFAREVADVEAVRRQIGADKMILIGHSWGGTLAAKYMQSYPGHVSKVIFHAPGDIWDWKDDFDYSRTDASDFPSFLPSLRFLAADRLENRSPEAAENLVSQREMEGLFVPMMDAEVGAMVCKGDRNRLPPEIAAMRAAHENPAFNLYVQLNIQFDNGDPHDGLRSDHTPAILLYPECNYIRWAGALDYRNTLPNLKIFYIPRAGHYIQMEQPDLMRRIMVAFLLDQPDVIPPVEGDAEPHASAGVPAH